MAYSMHGYSKVHDINRAQAMDVLGTFFVAYLVSGNFSASSLGELHRKKTIFATKYTGWDEAEDWLRGTVSESINDDHNSFSFVTMKGLAASIGEQYYKFNDQECRNLKHELGQMEGMKAGKPGRVRLSQFYKKALYSHWQFDEKVDYLRTLGVLDESDPKQSQVILPNYIMARTNCLEASSLYALCCQNECEGLMSHLEQALEASEAEPSRIAKLIAALPSDTVQASAGSPRELSATLLGRLNEVAAANSGKVPIHGRLFAQWMHHAYPRSARTRTRRARPNPSQPMSGSLRMAWRPPRHPGRRCWRRCRATPARPTALAQRRVPPSCRGATARSF
jgi:hypothetical protein